jgi:F-type H+-transporting ATPase subunit c
MLETLLLLAQEGAALPAEADAAVKILSSTTGYGLAVLGIGMGFGLTVLGAGKGIGDIGGNAVSAIARQPEAVGPIGTNMIIAAALIEGLAVISMVILAFVLAP